MMLLSRKKRNVTATTVTMAAILAGLACAAAGEIQPQAVGGVAYPIPDEWWAYIYNGNSLDVTWDHEHRPRYS